MANPPPEFAKCKNVDDDVCTVKSSPALHPTLSYSDGNVVLATEKSLYRVHKGILARHSKVFAGMLELPQPVVQDEMFEGLPIIHLAGDKDEDVENLLRVIYERNFFREGQENIIKVSTSLLRLSSKYEMDAIWQEVLDRLLTIFPATLESYDESGGPFDFLEDSSEDIFDLLSVARQTSADEILPLLFYSCSLEDEDVILRLSSRIASQDALYLLVGKMTLKAAIRDIILRNLDEPATCAKRACYLIKCEKYIGFSDDTNTSSHGLSLNRSKLADYWDNALCSNCMATFLDTAEKGRQDFWKIIPGCFGLET